MREYNTDDVVIDRENAICCPCVATLDHALIKARGLARIFHTRCLLRASQPVILAAIPFFVATMDFMFEGLTDASLYVNGTLDRYTNGTALIPRISGKIALEEAVGSSLWDAYTTLPATNQIDGYDGVPFDTVSDNIPWNPPGYTGRNPT